MCKNLYELYPHTTAHYKLKYLIICRHQIDGHGKFRMTEVLCYTLQKQYFSKSGTRPADITLFSTIK